MYNFYPFCLGSNETNPSKYSTNSPGSVYIKPSHETAAIFALIIVVIIEIHVAIWGGILRTSPQTYDSSHYWGLAQK